MSYNPSYTLQSSPPSPSDPIPSASPSPAPSDSYGGGYLPPLPIPPIFNHAHHPAANNHNHNHGHSHSPRQVYPTSSPYQPSPDPSASSLSKLRFPPPTPTSYFTNGYASPAASSYSSSSEPGSRDEIDMMEAGTLGGSAYHGGHALSQPGIDGMIFRGDGILLEKQASSSRNRSRERDSRKRWSMRDFTLMQTVGTHHCSARSALMTTRNRDIRKSVPRDVCQTQSRSAASLCFKGTGSRSVE